MIQHTVSGLNHRHGVQVLYLVKGSEEVKSLVDK